MKTKSTGLNAPTDSQWLLVRAILEPGERKRKVDIRLVFEALLYILRTGCQWRNLPDKYPHWSACHYYFDKWTRLGRLERASQALSEQDRKRERRRKKASMLVIDSQSVVLDPTLFEHRGTDGAKRVNGRKRIIAIDTSGRIVACAVTQANRHDSPAAAALLCDSIKEAAPEKVITDEGFRGTFARMVNGLGIAFEATGKGQDDGRGFKPVKWRWVVERTFAWMRFCRRLIHDHEHTLAAHKAFILLFNCSLMLNRLRNCELIS